MNRNSSNISEQLGTAPAALVVQCVLYAGLMVSGFVFNAAVIWLVYKKRQLRTITNMWVVSLCVSQLLTCTLSLPFVLISTVVDDWLLGYAFCQVFGFYTFIFRVVSILSIAGIAVDRYQVITRPFSKRMRKETARKFIILSWWSATVTCIPPLVGFGNYRYSNNGHICGISWIMGGASLIYSVFFISSVYVATALATFSSYCLIHKATDRHARKRKHSANVSKQGSSRKMHRDMNGESRSRLASANTMASARKRRWRALRWTARHPQLTLSGSTAQSTADHRATRTIILVLTNYVCCWLPYFIHALILGFGGIPVHRAVTASAQWWEFSVTCLSMSTCVWDPLLYGAFTQNFRAHFRSLFRCSRKGVFDRSKTYMTNKTISSQSAVNTSRQPTNEVMEVMPANIANAVKRTWSREQKSASHASTHVPGIPKVNDETGALSTTKVEIYDSLTELVQGGERCRRRSKSGDRRNRSSTVTSAENASFVMDDLDDVTASNHVDLVFSSSPLDEARTDPTKTPRLFYDGFANGSPNSSSATENFKRNTQLECLQHVKVHRLYGKNSDGPSATISAICSKTETLRSNSEDTVDRSKILPLSPQLSLETTENGGQATKQLKSRNADHRDRFHSGSDVTQMKESRTARSVQQKRITHI